MVVVVEQGQCLIDVALQHSGDIESLFNIALHNGISITDNVSFGTKLEISEVSNERMATYFKNNNIIPAGRIEHKEVQQLRGIDYDKIGLNFEVWQKQ